MTRAQVAREAAKLLRQASVSLHSVAEKAGISYDQLRKALSPAGRDRTGVLTEGDYLPKLAFALRSEGVRLRELAGDLEDLERRTRKEGG